MIFPAALPLLLGVFLLFNLVLGVQLTPREKAALVAFMRQL